MLGNAMRKYVTSENKNGYTPQVRSVYNNRIRKYAVQALKDLTLLAETLPEDQLAQIFSSEIMLPFTRSVYQAKYNKEYDKEEFERRRKRLLRLSYDTLTEIGFNQNAWDLAPDVMKILTHAGGSDFFPVFGGLKGIYIKAFNMPEEEKKY